MQRVAGYGLVGDLPFQWGVEDSSQALVAGGDTFDYGSLRASIDQVAGALTELATGAGARVAIWLEKRAETVLAMFGAARAGLVYVPINPLLKGAQAAYILRDCNVEILVTNSQRWETLQAETYPDLRFVVVVDGQDERSTGSTAVFGWSPWLEGARLGVTRRPIDADMAAILYTSGSTGHPKGVVLSHRNIVEGARSVSSYLENRPEDRILALLPLSFDYGMSQLTTGFLVGATVVLHNYLLAQDVLRVLVRERITGLAAVPPVWIQLAALLWPESIDAHLRYFTNSGGAMPTATLQILRRRAPRAKPFLMYGLTEAFRSTYLPPEHVDARPTSIGKAIPNAEIRVVRPDGAECAPNEPGELVHRGALVALGYWNDPQKTAERFRPLPGQAAQLVLSEIAVWSGDTVVKDDEGFLYFVSRSDEMIKTSGYRVSPTEVEEVLYGTGLVAEAVAFGVEHPTIGQAICVVAHAARGHIGETQRLLDACKMQLPAYMLPHRVEWQTEPLPRNANGKIDRKALAARYATIFLADPVEPPSSGSGL